MKEFDLEAAKKGAEVCTRDGRNGRIICFNRKTPNYPIVYVVENDFGVEEILTATLYGRFYDCEGNPKHRNDLMMKSLKKEGWINIYDDGDAKRFIYASKDEALRFACEGRIDTVKVEWEE